jgi:hypothetical protein
VAGSVASRTDSDYACEWHVLVSVATTRGSHVRECQRLFGSERGRVIIEMIEEVTGQPCPCKRGLRCLLTPPIGGVPFPPPVVIPAPRAVEREVHSA